MIRPLTPAWRLRATLAALWYPPLVHLVALERLGGWARRGLAAQPDPAVDDQALAEWVDRVLGWMPWPWHRTCLKRSMAIYALLARAGRPVALQVGVRRDSAGALAAHAWLEREGEVVLERGPESIRELQVITSLAAGRGAR